MSQSFVLEEKAEPRSVVVAVQNLSKTFDGKVKAVDDISFEIQEGEIFGFLGPNRAGKTTTIKMPTTLLRPSSIRISNGVVTHARCNVLVVR